MSWGAGGKWEEGRYCKFLNGKVKKKRNSGEKKETIVLGNFSNIAKKCLHFKKLNL